MGMVIEIGGRGDSLSDPSTIGSVAGCAPIAFEKGVAKASLTWTPPPLFAREFTLLAPDVVLAAPLLSLTPLLSLLSELGLTGLKPA
jgi:hypothetical protein